MELELYGWSWSYSLPLSGLVLSPPEFPTPVALGNRVLVSWSWLGVCPWEKQLGIDKLPLPLLRGGEEAGSLW